ncbi:hypothetical protein F2P79_024571 [Pimephales promelas]|nr:hypothetical protein F2P79_024571 [Pimephales promelas]
MFNREQNQHQIAADSTGSLESCPIWAAVYIVMTAGFRGQSYTMEAVQENPVKNLETFQCPLVPPALGARGSPQPVKPQRLQAGLIWDLLHPKRILLL